MFSFFSRNYKHLFVHFCSIFLLSTQVGNKMIQPHNVTPIFLLKQIKFKVTDATTSATDVTQKTKKYPSSGVNDNNNTLKY
jgi:hypothetical protein